MIYVCMSNENIAQTDNRRDSSRSFLWWLNYKYIIIDRIIIYIRIFITFIYIWLYYDFDWTEMRLISPGYRKVPVKCQHHKLNLFLYIYIYHTIIMCAFKCVCVCIYFYYNLLNICILNAKYWKHYDLRYLSLF